MSIDLWNVGSVHRRLGSKGATCMEVLGESERGNKSTIKVVVIGHRGAEQ